MVDRAESSASFVPTLEPGLLPSASTESSLREELLALLARLFLSLLSLDELEPEVPRLRLLELLDPAPTGLSRSKPNCSNERLKEVAFAGRVKCSCGGQLEEDMRAFDKKRLLANSM